MSADLQRLTEELMGRALDAGADAADCIAFEDESVEVEISAGALDSATREEQVDIGLRVLVGQRQACVSSSLLTEATFADMVERALAMAREAPEDPYAGLADPSQLAESREADALDLIDPDGVPDLALLETRAREAEAAALAVAGVSKVSASVAGYGRTRAHLSASNGFSAGYGWTGQGGYCEAISGSGLEMQRDAFGDHRIYGVDLFGPEKIGRIAGERAVAAANPQKPRTGAYPVLYDERVAGGLIGHLIMAANGSAVARGSSWLLDRLGAQVLPKGLTLREDPLRPRATSSRPFDAEGLACRPRNIVEDGVLTGWTLDLASARKLGMESTGNAARQAAGLPRPTTSNLELTQSDQSPEALMAEMGTGLLVTSMIGSTINPNTGDYSRGANGFWIENGEIAYPVAECTIAGNLHEMLATIRPANDARPWASRVVPSLLVEGMTLAGA